MKKTAKTKKISLEKFRRFTLRFIVTVVSILFVGFLIETVIIAYETKTILPQGKLINVTQNKKQHIYCTGIGSPTIILESGLGESSMTWVDIQPKISTHNRVCSYDRAGLGWSDAASGNRTAEIEATELHTLLQLANEQGPYIFVGHSLGGFIGRIFTVKYKNEVQSLVLIDPSNEAFLNESDDEGVYNKALRTVTPYVYELGSRVGIGRFVIRHGGMVENSIGSSLPVELKKIAPFIYSADRLHTGNREEAVFKNSAIAARDKASSLSPTPITFILPDHSINDAQNLCEITSECSVVKAGDTGHYVQYDNPDLVISTIKEVIAKEQ